MTPTDVKKSQKEPVSNVDPISLKKNSKLKGGSIHEIGEIDDEYLDENLHNNNF